LSRIDVVLIAFLLCIVILVPSRSFRGSRTTRSDHEADREDEEDDDDNDSR